MREKISFKGIIIGAVFDIIASPIVGAIFIYVYVSVNHIDHVDPKTIATAPAVMVFSYILGALVSILSGYIAAYIAKHDELLNGATSSFLCVLMGIVGLAYGGSDHSLFLQLVEIVTTPILGLAGGYIAMKTKQKSI